MQRLTCLVFMTFPLPWEKTVLAGPLAYWSTCNFTYALVSLPDQCLRSLVWKGDCVCLCTRLENGALHSKQQPSSAVNSFTNKDKFKVMMTLSSHRARRKLQFLAKIFRVIVVEQKGLNRLKIALHYRSLLHLAVSCEAFGLLYESC